MIRRGWGKRRVTGLGEKSAMTFHFLRNRFSAKVGWAPSFPTRLNRLGTQNFTYEAAKIHVAFKLPRWQWSHANKVSL